MGETPAKAGNVGINLTEGSIFKLLLRFAIPLLLANFVQQLYNTVDMIVIGQYVGNVGTVGVSTGGDIATMLTFVGTSLGTAGQIYIAQLSGARERQAIKETIGTLISFSVLLSILFAAACIVFCDPFLGWLNCPPEALGQARNYMVIVSLGLPFVFGYNAICGALRGMGESKRPLLFVSVAAVANLLLDLLLVAVIPMEAAGTAIATVAGQFASFLASAIFLQRHGHKFDFEFKPRNFSICRSHLSVLLELGIPLTLQSACIHFSQLICSAQVNSFGLLASTTNSIGNKVNKMVNIFTSSINGGTSAMVGQNLGARKYDRVRKTIYTALGMCAIFSAGACVIALFFPKTAFSLFTQDQAVMEGGVVFMRVSVITFVLSAVHGPYMASVTGSGHAKLNFLAGMLDGVILRLGISFSFAYWLEMGVVGFYYGNALARLGPVVIGIVYFYSGKWKTRKLLLKEK